MTKQRIGRLRAELAAQQINGFIVPRNDEHFGEWVPASAERLAWLTGFTGSAGFAIVLDDRAAVFVDGRYTLQVRDQVDLDLFEPRHITEEPAGDWLREALKAGDRLGYDPWLHTEEGLKRLAKAADAAGAALVPVDRNPVDAIWTERPAAPMAPVVPHEDRFAGRPSAEKRAEIAAELAGKGVDAAVLTLPESFAWLLNIRGGDVPRTPLPLGFAILHADAAVDLYMAPEKLSDATIAHLGGEVRRHAPGDFLDGLDRLADRTVLVDKATAVAAVTERLAAAGAKLVRGSDPTALPKARKNEAEIAGARAAHVRDGAAVTKFLAWLDAQAPGTVDEMTAAEKLEGYRREDNLMRDLSFDTISGSGPNGAIVHYRVTEETNRTLGAGELFLVDSGAQYLDGTTDITRTVAIGEPSAEMRERFTRVLKGHIALATARFPKGTTGSQLDTLARLPLWQAGLDFDHGTGHGVGSYLSVHEGPQRISKLPNAVPLEPGMIVSNEPGYYRTGEYGIRIENLVTVVAVETPGGERETLGFETLTHAPIDRRLIDADLLTAAERDWLNAYHAGVRERLGALDADTAHWLTEATRPI
ncbi:aminopeptidase P family protein [Minwuia thermotolerans]|uniref:X-Pro aminopeptidase n=1 Tax=Minwuia thermotolerans TaxID=2056226 RepID=A0A2M9G5T7_9PROT|nr:aminopeptidase P family protein [Minwuia thermotolerans]PJK31071.1 X-Pro aminopeptidase [Minwuia thermotolerans]